MGGEVFDAFPKLPLVRSPVSVLRSQYINTYVRPFCFLLVLSAAIIFSTNAFGVFGSVTSFLVALVCVLLAVRASFWVGSMDFSRGIFDIIFVENEQVYCVDLGGIFQSSKPVPIASEVTIQQGTNRTIICFADKKLTFPNSCLAWKDGTLLSGEQWPSIQPQFDLKNKCWSGIDRKNKEHQRLALNAMNPFL